MSRVLVIGGTRFFGKRLVKKLLQQGHEVTIVTRGNLQSHFSDVEHIFVDREDRQALQTAVGSQEWDIIYDNICYSPQSAADACEIFASKVKRYIFTSTVSVYEFGDGFVKEEDFDPYTYPIQSGERSDFPYGEAKRLAEAVFFQKATFPVSAVRIPFVVGEDDYTRRLHFHIEQIKKEKPMGMPNREAILSFIHSEEVADFLIWIGEQTLEGPIQASGGHLSLNQLIDLIEKRVQKKAIIAKETDEEFMSPYGAPDSCYLDVTKATQAGYRFPSIDDWFPKLLNNLIH